MTVIHVVVDFWSPAFHGLNRDGSPEWPPSPFRLAQALMAGCHRPTFDAQARAALESLTNLENPVITAPAAQQVRLPNTYTHRSGGPMEGEQMPSGKLEKILDLTVAGLTTANRTAKPESMVVLDDCRVVYEVDDPEEAVDTEALGHAALRVPYFGRSQDSCDITVSRAATTPGTSAERSAMAYRLGDPLGERWYPRSDSRGAVRGWAANSCEWMDQNYESTTGGSQLPVFSPEPYITRLGYRRGQLTDAGSRSVAVIPVADSIQSSGIPAFMRTLGALPDHVTPFPCVVANHHHADGRLLGVGLCSDDGDALEDGLEILLARRDMVSRLDLVTQALQPSYWERSSRYWCSATPLRAFPDDRVAQWVISRDMEQRLGQRPEITWSKSPIRPWQRAWPQPEDGLGAWWAEVAFPMAVSGPLTFGETREQGFGLFVPDGSRS